MATLTIGAVKRTANVITRHHKDCPDRAQGMQYQNCKCFKSIVIYDGKTRFKSAGTRSWSEAETFAKNYLKSFDPDVIELKAHRAAKERASIRIEDAVAKYTADMIVRRGNGRTVQNMQVLLGCIDPETKAVIREGHLFSWLNKQVPRLDFLSELTADKLHDWRASWKFKSDLTASQSWGMVEQFFTHSKKRKWIDENPTDEMDPLVPTKGNRTAVFSDSQYDDILSAANRITYRGVQNKLYQERLLAFVDLMRWSGCDVVDAVQFRPEQVRDGVFRYRRQKSKVLATIPLPDHVVGLLRNLPLESDSVGPEMPFKSKNISAHSDTRTWQNRLGELFNLAGIKSVRTEIGQIKKPHSKMLRDTMAVYYLRKGISVMTVSKYLGHSNVTTTIKHYLPWVKELEDAAIAEGRKVLDAIEAGVPRGTSDVLEMKRRNR
jgi:integrase